MRRFMLVLVAFVMLASAAPAPGWSWVPPQPWRALADCESGDGTGTPPYYATWDFDGYHDGGYQFLPSTWVLAIRMTPGWQPRYAHLASPQVQTRVAKRWLRATSWWQWPVCARRIGLI